MTLLEMKKKILSLIEELSPENEYLTDDPDIQAKINEVINGVMFELSRFKKISKYAEIEVKKGDVITFADLEREVGNEVYKIELVTGVPFTLRANGTVIKIDGEGTAEIDCSVYPERITEKTKDNAYEFELTPDVLEIMPYGVAGNLLKSDVSAQYGTVYTNEYEKQKQMLDVSYAAPMIHFEGGINV